MRLTNNDIWQSNGDRSQEALAPWCMGLPLDHTRGDEETKNLPDIVGDTKTRQSYVPNFER